MSTCIGCYYCKQEGHFIRDCPVLKLKNERKKRFDSSFPKLVEVSTNKPVSTQKNMRGTYASLVVNSLTPEEHEAMENLHQEKMERDAERKRLLEVARESRLEKQFGSFWYFIVEGTKNDCEKAIAMRKSTYMQNEFKRFIRARFEPIDGYDFYEDEWVQDTKDSCFDCVFLARWRREVYENSRVEAHKMFVQMSERFLDILS